MTARPEDQVLIESVDGSDIDVECDRLTSVEITNDLSSPARALIELGDEDTWGRMSGALDIGTRYRVSVNGRLRLVGRMLAKRQPLSPDGGATVQLTIQTLLADAAYASCDPTINLRNATLKDVLLRAYEPLGLAEADFIFGADLAVDLMTGKGGAGRDVALDELKEDQAKVHPPETIFAFVERHLNRFHLSHWDSCDGRIVVGAPDDSQDPIYRLCCLQTGNGQTNNICKAERIIDYEQTPSILGVFGVGGGKEYAKAKVRALETDPVLSEATPKVYRPVLIVDEGVKTQGQAEARARREMSARSRQKDAWRIEVDGLAYWDGETATPWGIDTVADVQVDVAGEVAFGPYLVTRTTLRGDADSGYTTELDLVARGVWRL